MNDSGEITALLSRLRQGDREAFNELMPFVYEEMRRLAARLMRRERESHTLQATALAHEAYLRLLGTREVSWENRAHFFGVAARAMRRILVEHARGKARRKRGGGRQRVTLDEVSSPGVISPLDLLALDESLNALATLDPRKARVVELLYFGGLTRAEAAEVLGVTRKTVTRDWQFARRWLIREMSRGRASARGVVGSARPRAATPPGPPPPRRATCKDVEPGGLT